MTTNLPVSPTLVPLLLLLPELTRRTDRPAAGLPLLDSDSEPLDSELELVELLSELESELEPLVGL